MKIEPHQKLSSRNPPTTGPSATPSPAVAAQTPIAVARSRGSAKTLISERQRRRHDERGPDAHHRAGQRSARRCRPSTRPPPRRAPKTASPHSRSGAGARSDLRARPRAAAARRTRACRRRPPTAARSRPRRGRAPGVGRATLTIVLSTTIASRLTHRTARASQRSRGRVIVRSAERSPARRRAPPAGAARGPGSRRRRRSARCSRGRSR